MRVRFVCFLLPGALVVAACNTERSEPARRDLTLLPSAESATAAVVSARELDLPKPDAGVSSTSAVRAPTPAPARVHAQPARKSDHSATVAPVPAPNSEPAPSSPAPGPKDAAVAGGAGTPLEPGQTVTLIPASAGAGAAPLPASDVSTEQGIRARPWIIIGDDRCIPGRGEVMPRGHRGWRSVTY